jgi:YYY domain-containing protein
VELVFNWLWREGGIVLSWWALVTLAGVAAFPLCARLLSGLPDRGYTLARAAGLLVVGFVFWLLASLGFIQNTPGNIALSWVIVLVGGLVLYFRTGSDRVDWRAWWQTNRAAVITAEILFIVLLFSWSILRAYNPDLSTTEKPMEMMMLNSVMRSPIFPPHDAWMSGYSISYYYFGYVIAAMLTTMSGVNGAVGFSMTNALLFSLTALTAFGVAYNLVRSRAAQRDEEKQPRPYSAVLAGLLGMFFVAMMGNGQTPIIELPYLQQPGINSYLQFWDTQSRDNAVSLPVPIENGFDWFRASRVLTDRQLNGDLEVFQLIDEFPQFSFILADNHPHVLAIPFAVLALGLALNVALSAHAPKPPQIVFYGICLGGLVFLNAWDGPIYMVLLVGADMLRRQIKYGKLAFSDWMEGFFLGVALIVLTLALYLPFFIGFRSQASGILPNVIWPTRFQQYFIMFGPFVVLLFPFLILEAWRARQRMNWILGLSVAGILIGVLIVFIIVTVAIGTQLSLYKEQIEAIVAQFGGYGPAFAEVLGRRLSPMYLLTTLVLLAGVVLVVARLFPRRAPEESETIEAQYTPSTAFALLMVGAAVMLTLLPDYVYLRDNFGTRMNTVFKFYYQAWVIFGIASAYAVYTFMDDFRLPLPSVTWRYVYGVLLVWVIALGSLYPLIGNYKHMLEGAGTRISPDGTQQISLDGGPHMLQSYDDYQALMCLAEEIGDNNTVVAVEAVRGSYWAGAEPDTGRIGALIGVITVLGWENHESQWRGVTYSQAAGSRNPDITSLYEDTRWDTVQPIIERYGIEYILYGYAERSTFSPIGEQKFIENADTICSFGNTRIYRVRQQAMASG